MKRNHFDCVKIEANLCCLWFLSMPELHLLFKYEWFICNKICLTQWNQKLGSVRSPLSLCAWIRWCNLEEIKKHGLAHFAATNWSLKLKSLINLSNWNQHTRMQPSKRWSILISHIFLPLFEFYSLVLLTTQKSFVFLYFISISPTYSAVSYVLLLLILHKMNWFST